MKISGHCSKRIAQRVGIKSKARQKQWVHKKLNAGKWKPLEGSRYRVNFSQFAFIVEKGREVVVVTMLTPKND